MSAGFFDSLFSPFPPLGCLPYASLRGISARSARMLPTPPHLPRSDVFPNHPCGDFLLLEARGCSRHPRTFPRSDAFPMHPCGDFLRSKRADAPDTPAPSPARMLSLCTLAGIFARSARVLPTPPHLPRPDVFPNHPCGDFLLKARGCSRHPCTFPAWMSSLITLAGISTSSRYRMRQDTLRWRMPPHPRRPVQTGPLGLRS